MTDAWVRGVQVRVDRQEEIVHEVSVEFCIEATRAHDLRADVCMTDGYLLTVPMMVPVGGTRPLELPRELVEISFLLVDVQAVGYDGSDYLVTFRLEAGVPTTVEPSHVADAVSAAVSAVYGETFLPPGPERRRVSRHRNLRYEEAHRTFAEVNGDWAVGAASFTPEATEKAWALLSEHLDETQRQDLARLGHFHVTGGVTGARYRVGAGRQINVVDLTNARTVCGVFLGVPLGDHLLAQALMLQGPEEERFLEAAEIYSHDGSHLATNATRAAGELVGAMMQREIQEAALRLRESFEELRATFESVVVLIDVAPLESTSNEIAATRFHAGNSTWDMPILTGMLRHSQPFRRYRRHRGHGFETGP